MDKRPAAGFARTSGVRRAGHRPKPGARSPGSAGPVRRGTRRACFRKSEARSANHSHNHSPDAGATLKRQGQSVRRSLPPVRGQFTVAASTGRRVHRRYGADSAGGYRYGRVAAARALLRTRRSQEVSMSGPRSVTTRGRDITTLCQPGHPVRARKQRPNDAGRSMRARRSPTRRQPPPTMRSGEAGRFVSGSVAGIRRMVDRKRVSLAASRHVLAGAGLPAGCTRFVVRFGTRPGDSPPATRAS